MSASPEQKRAVLCAIATGSTREEAAIVAGVTTRTVRRWMELPGFRAELRRLREDAVMESLDLLIAYRVQAVKRIAETIDKGDSDAVKLKAAGDLLTFITRYRDTVDVAEQLGELQRRLAELSPGDPVNDKDNSDDSTPTDS